jgi:hypothetical protein
MGNSTAAKRSTGVIKEIRLPDPKENLGMLNDPVYRVVVTPDDGTSEGTFYLNSEFESLGLSVGDEVSWNAADASDLKKNS